MRCIFSNPAEQKFIGCDYHPNTWVVNTKHNNTDDRKKNFKKNILTTKSTSGYLNALLLISY